MAAHDSGTPGVPAAPRGPRPGALWLLPPAAVLALAAMGASIWDPRALQPAGQGGGAASDAVVTLGRGHLGTGHADAGYHSVVVLGAPAERSAAPAAVPGASGPAASPAVASAPRGAAPAAGRNAPSPGPGAAPVPAAQVPVPVPPPGAAESVAACAQLLPRLPTVDRALCESTRLSESGARSRKGTPLYWRDVAPAAGAPGAPEPLRVLVVGAIHGDELTSASLALRWIGFAGQPLPASRQAVHWRFIPVLNPDGLLARPATRVNARGVDLNRNFPTPNWERDAPLYWEKRTRRDPRRWPGPEPLSEPESRFLHTQMEGFRPDLVVSIHAPYGVLDYDGPLPPPSRLGQLRLDQLGIFPGSLGHYGSVRQGMPVVTIELQHELRMPDDQQVRQMWRDLLRWMDTHLAATDTPAGGISGK
ncbi:M14 family zinc carboxypeptidase [Acidovorax sp. NCPPB 4044]|uniref:M14 family zinc carboxypeptidase n=1 Tax=Acidovorax sp. NCPPB 4044 TaxID=2940490 RepID=UPI0023024228|nr:M14 family zinc carboxypeptidase [Acidovorax sp. NCPPB 4044]MDA8523189.1 murein peptide amidase A [Acidovorax sp. NCPPB 4044]